MGNTKLMKSLRAFQRAANISEYQGKTVAIDGPSILYHGGFAAARDVALSQSNDFYVNYFMRFMGLLEKNGIVPIVIFDGFCLPFKQKSVMEERKFRQSLLERGLELYRQGNRFEAVKFFRWSTTVSIDTSAAVVEKLMENKIQCIIAPYEAAAQLAYLAKTGKVDTVVTEDFDPLAYGCPKVISKFDVFGNCLESSIEKIINDKSGYFKQFTADTVRHYSIFAGSDYLPRIKGVDFHFLLRSFKHNKTAGEVMKNLLFRFKQDIPENYVRDFRMADLGILHQWVYDTDENNYVRLNPLTSECSEQDVVLLGSIPTAQDLLAIYRVNKVIPKPVKECITEEPLACADAAKSSVTSHLESTCSLSSPKSSKWPKTPKSRSIDKKSFLKLTAPYPNLSDPEVKTFYRLVRGKKQVPQSPPPSPPTSPVPPPQSSATPQNRKRSFDQMASPTPPPPPKRIKTA